MLRSTRPLPARIGLALAVTALALLDVASGDSASPPATEPPPDIRITEPENHAIRATGSFDIAGDFAGSATEIEVFADGRLLGPALRGDEPFDWRLPARSVSLSPGLHEISVVATGEGGQSRPDVIEVLVDPNLTFDVRVDPEEASYEPGEDDDDPRLLLLGNDVDLRLSVTAPDRIDASVSEALRTGADTTVRIDVMTETPGTYPVTVTAEGPDGTVREATHTITILGDPPETPPLPPGAIGDAFEGGDQWTAATTSATNGAEADATTGAGGNPGSFRDMKHTLPGTSDGEGNPTRIVVVHTFTGAGWDPATDGPIDRLVWSEDQIMLDPPFDGAAVGTLAVVMQGGETFTASVNEGNAFTNTTWQTVSVELRASDFSGDGPDFSENGAPITFGILRSNTHRGSGEIVVRHGLDNWTVEVVSG